MVAFNLFSLALFITTFSLINSLTYLKNSINMTNIPLNNKTCHNSIAFWTKCICI